MSGKRALVFPLIFVLVLVPFVIAAFMIFQPGEDDACENQVGLPNTVPHSHGVGLVTEVQDGMQLIFNVSDGAALYELVDGQFQLCSGELTDDMKHITVDVNDAMLNPGERLPVTVTLEVRRQDSGETVVQAAAPAMYAPGHGYHFGDNFKLAPDAAYEWTVTISPVEALRQEGAQNLWLEPVTWDGRFVLDAEGSVADKQASPTVIGDFSQRGVHVTLSESAPEPLYEVSDGVSVPQDTPAGARYFIVDVTDHVVNYEEKLPGAEVQLTFRQGETVREVSLPPVISPRYGFHYGANIDLAPGTWDVTVRVDGLDVLRHAGAAVSLAGEPVSDSFTVTLDEAGAVVVEDA